MVTIKINNLILIITDACPSEFSECAIRCLDRRLPKAQVRIDDEPKMHIPRFSKFIGQLR